MSRPGSAFPSATFSRAPCGCCFEGSEKAAVLHVWSREKIEMIKAEDFSFFFPEPPGGPPLFSQHHPVDTKED